MTNISDLVDISFLIGEQVSVWAGKSEKRNNFETAISIDGILEQGKNGQFRVVRSNGTYTYFWDRDIIGLTYDENHTFQDGSKAVIKLEI